MFWQGNGALWARSLVWEEEQKPQQTAKDRWGLTSCASMTGLISKKSLAGCLDLVGGECQVRYGVNDEKKRLFGMKVKRGGEIRRRRKVTGCPSAGASNDTIPWALTRRTLLPWKWCQAAGSTQSGPDPGKTALRSRESRVTAHSCASGHHRTGREW